MNKWSIEYYVDDRGVMPVKEFINSLPVHRQANIFRVFDLVKEFGIKLGQPYLKPVSGKIWEMRPGNSRILYFVHTGKKFILLHGFTKKTRKTPKQAIRLAEKRKTSYEKRY